jgi:Conserved protein containing a Zn-ribbon-like motif, possibly RNA-binding
MDRPLTGEPLSLDLVNTLWLRGDGEIDALGTEEGLADWLLERKLNVTLASEPVRVALLHTRAVLRAILEGQPGAEDRLNAVLARGLISRSLRNGRPERRVVFADPAWGLAWEAAEDYLRLREASGHAIRRCEREACVLYFFDPSGRRRWCSMAACGNRAKAQRHYARQREAAQSGPGPAAPESAPAEHAANGA